MEKVKELLLVILQGIVENPIDIKITETLEKDKWGDIRVLTVTPHETDIGVVMGMGGMNAKAIRRVVMLYGRKQLHERLYVRFDNLDGRYGSFDWRENAT